MTTAITFLLMTFLNVDGCFKTVQNELLTTTTEEGETNYNFANNIRFLSLFFIQQSLIDCASGNS
jgi:hypothetical protein